jgi:DNA helicase-2/ATP-dependent DNA helicase PcrA
LGGAMKNNKLLIAAAGSGKTTYLINKACEINGESVLITTYTEANEAEIKKKIIKKKGCVPSNITIQTWFSFLLQHGVRPYQSVLDESLHDENIGFYLISEKSGKRFDNHGNPIFIHGNPIYWGEKDFKKYYFSESLNIYSDKISKFVFLSNKKSKNQVIERIERIFNHIFIDEVQDLAGYDLELLKLFFKSQSSVLLIGDPRQVTYLTNHSPKFEKYSDGQIKTFVEKELGKKIQCEVDEATLNLSHRNNQMICNYSAKLYPSLPVPSACTCRECRDNITDHEGVFLIKPSDVEKYLSIHNPLQLRWSSSVRCNPGFQLMNFGESKGLEFDRVLIYPTRPIMEWVKNNNSELANEARAKLYVGITRAHRTAAIVVDYDEKDLFEGIEKYSGFFNGSVLVNRKRAHLGVAQET